MATVSGPLAAPDYRAIQERYAARLKARLARPALDVRDARDGILDCFVATYYAGMAQGLEHVLGVRAGDDEVARVTAALFRRRLRERGLSFDEPTVEGLAEVKESVDRELHVTELPGELRGIHDQVCSLLLAKADGSLPHAGARSVVDRPGTAPSSTPARVGVRAGAVQASLRAAVAAWLHELAERTTAGAPPVELRAGLDRAERLVATLDEFER